MSEERPRLRHAASAADAVHAAASSASLHTSSGTAASASRSRSDSASAVRVGAVTIEMGREGAGGAVTTTTENYMPSWKIPVHHLLSFQKTDDGTRRRRWTADLLASRPSSPRAFH